MTIHNTQLTVSYAGDGSSTVFPVPFPFFGPGEVEVIRRTIASGAEQVMTPTTDYAVAGGDGGTGTVTMAAPPPATVQLHVRRRTDRRQQVDYVENDPFPAETHERALDRRAAVDLEQDEVLRRTLRYPRTDGLDGELAPQGQRALTVLGFDAVGRHRHYPLRPDGGLPLDLSHHLVTADGTPTPRRLGERFAEVVNVKDMGAVGGGQVDDSPAWRAAILRAIELTVAGRRTKVYAPPDTYLWGDAAVMPPITQPIVIEGDARIRLNRQADPGNNCFFHLGNPANDPEEGQPAAPGIAEPVLRDLKLEVAHNPWLGCEILGPFSGDTNSWTVTFAEPVRRASNQMMIVDGQPFAVDRYLVTGFPGATLDYDTLVPPGATVWFLRVPETAWALDIMGTVRTRLENLTVLGAPGFAHEGWRQRSNGTRFLNTYGNFFVYSYPGSLTAQQARQGEGDLDEESMTRPHPGWVFVAANEAADGSRTSFTFTLAPATPGEASAPLRGVEQFARLRLGDTLVSAVDYDSAGWGTGEIAVELDAAPDQAPVLEHYVIPVGLPTSFYVMNNSGPVWFDKAHWLGAGGDHSGGGAFWELVPDNGYPPAPSLWGGATGDTKFFNHVGCQAFWQPYVASTSWEETNANEAADGSRTSFTFTFATAVPEGRFRALVAGAPVATSILALSGFGTTTVTAVFPEPPAETPMGRRTFRVTPLGKPYGLYMDYTRGHVSNLFWNGSVLDHTTVAGIYLFTLPDADGIPYPQGGDFRSFARTNFIHKQRIMHDKGRALLIDAASTRPLAGLSFEDLETISRRDDPVIEFGGNYSALSFDNLRIHEAQTSAAFWPDRPALIRVNPGSGDWSLKNSSGGNIGGAAAGGGRVIARAVVEMTDPYARKCHAVGNRFPAGSLGYAAFFKHRRYVARTIPLEADPFFTVEADLDGDGSPDGFNPNVRVRLPAGQRQLRPGQFFTLAGAEGGNGVAASLLNGERVVGRVLTDAIFVIYMNPYYRGENPVNAAGDFGGSGVTLTIYEDGYIRHEVTDEDVFHTTAGSSLVRARIARHGAWEGAPLVIPAVAAAVGGLAPEDLQGSWTVDSIPDPDHVVFEIAATASDDDSGGGAATLQLWWSPDDNPEMVDLGNTPGASDGEKSLKLPDESPQAAARIVYVQPDGRKRARSFASLVADIGLGIGYIDPLPIAKGGTNATSAATARANLGVPAASVTVTGGNLASGGGNLTLDRVISVLGSTASDIWLGSAGNRAVTCAALRDAETPTALTDAGTIAINQNLGRNFEVTLGGNRTLGALANAKPGSGGVVKVTHGAYTLGFHSAWRAAGGSAPGGSGTTLLAYYVDAAGNAYITMPGKDFA